VSVSQLATQITDSSVALKIGYAVETTQGSIEALSSKVGMVALVLGAMHFFNLYIFNRLRRRAQTFIADVNQAEPVAAGWNG